MGMGDNRRSPKMRRKRSQKKLKARIKNRRVRAATERASSKGAAPAKSKKSQVASPLRRSPRGDRPARCFGVAGRSRRFGGSCFGGPRRSCSRRPYGVNGSAVTVARRPSTASGRCPDPTACGARSRARWSWPRRRERTDDVTKPASGLRRRRQLGPPARPARRRRATRPTSLRLMWPRLVARAITSWPR